MTKQELNVVADDAGLRVEGAGFQGGASWAAKALSSDKVLLQKTSSTPAPESGLGRCSVELFSDFLIGLHHQGWSGMVMIETGQGVKRLYFERGSLVFAGSNIMDDRLGEIIYRQGAITIDQLTDSAVKVDKRTKFGQVLLNSGIFSTVDLSAALRAQVREILRSVFVPEGVYFELQDGENLAPTQVVFPEGTKELLLESMCYGAAMRDFMRDLGDDVVIQINQDAVSHMANYAGTFLADFLGLVQASKTRRELVVASKLTENNTIAYLMFSYFQGICHVGIHPSQVATTPGRFESELSRLRAKMDAYSVLVPMVRKVFSDNNVAFPAQDVKKFVANLNPRDFLSLFVDDASQIQAMSSRTLMAQSRAVPARAQRVEQHIESMIQFLLQITGDLLPFAISKQVRSNFRELTT